MAMLQIISAVCVSQWVKITVELLDKLVKNDLYLPPGVKLNIYRNTLRYSGVQIWNDLPADVKQVPYVQIFESKYTVNNILIQRALG